MRTSIRTLTLATLVLGLAAGCGGSNSKRGSAAAGSTAGTATTSTTPGTTPGGGTSTGATASTTSTTPAVQAPQVTSIAPADGPLDGGTQVVIQGSGFQASGAGETFVLFGDQGLVRVTPTSDSELRFTAPLARTAGQVDVRVVNDLGSGVLSGAWTYDPRAPRLVFAPNVGHYELGLGGTKITLSLARFAPVTSSTAVAFGGRAASAITVIDSNTLVAEVPQGVAPGQVDVEVTEGTQAVKVGGFLVQDQLGYGDLTINELCPHPGGIDANDDGVGDSKADEFVEIVNTTHHPIDLTYLTIWDGAQRERHRFLNPTSLPPGGAITVFGGGTAHGFAAPHHSGSAQQATADELALNNRSDTIELRTQPGLSAVGQTIFRVDYTNPPTGSSLVNRHDGQAILANPATNADYVDHVTLPNAPRGFSPSRKVDGSPF